jgi:hypothetical protein
MVSKYELALTEFNHPKIHGSSTELHSHFMCFLKVVPHEFYNEYPQEYSVLHNSDNSYHDYHPIIQCYTNILRKNGTFHLDIVETQQLSTGELICILKTFWLSIFQRKWRLYFKKKMAFYKNPKSLMIREINGSFKIHLNEQF